MAGRFERKKTSNGQFMFNLRAGNGEIVLTSQRYSSSGGVRNGVRSVRAHARSDANYVRRCASNGKQGAWSGTVVWGTPQSITFSPAAPGNFTIAVDSTSSNNHGHFTLDVVEKPAP